LWAITYQELRSFFSLRHMNDPNRFLLGTASLSLAIRDRGIRSPFAGRPIAREHETAGKGADYGKTRQFRVREFSIRFLILPYLGMRIANARDRAGTIL